MGPCLSTGKVNSFANWDDLDKEIALNDSAKSSVHSTVASLRKPVPKDLPKKIGLFESKKSARDLNLAPPAGATGTKHPSLILDSDTWDLFLDEWHNPYFYNKVTFESQWTIPEELRNQHIFDHKDYITVNVKVPKGVKGGDEFTVDVYFQPIDLICPDDCGEGDEIELRFPLYTDEAAAATATATGDAEDEVVDAMVAWAALADAAGESLLLIEKDVTLAKDVLSQVSGGCYLDDLIFQLTWSHRMAKLELAVKECYRCKGDYRDSSAYDNCKGVPRYATAGLVEWWQDLKAQRGNIESALASNEHDRVFGDTGGLFRSDDQERRQLEESILNGDTNSILKGLLQRKKAIELDIDNDIAQMIAIVSIEGPPKPPTKESIDAVHDYLLESIGAANTDLIDMTEDLEEFVATTLEPRHRFCVDVVTNMALLEFELESLNKQIAEFQSIDAPSSTDSAEQVEGGIELDADAKAASEAAGAEVTHNEALQTLLASQQLAANQLAESLEAKKNTQKKALLERIEQQRIKKLAQYKKSGMDQDEAAALVQEESEAEIANALQKIQDDINAALKAHNQKTLEDMKRLGESEELRLSSELENKKNKQLKSLQDRLNRRKEAKTLELANASSNQQLTTEQLEAAIDGAMAEIDREGAVEEAQITENCLDQIRDSRGTILQDIKCQYDLEQQRLENDLLQQQERSKRALRARLSKKLHREAAAILQKEADAGNSISTPEALARAQAECDAEEAEAIIQIEQKCTQEVVESRESVVAALKEMHIKEVVRLQEEMKNMEDRQRSSLQKRLDARRREKEAEMATAQHDTAKQGKIKQELEEEEARAKAESEAFISKIKAQHKEEAEELGLALLDKQTSGNLNLKKRLAQRKAKAEAKSLNEKASAENDTVKLDELIAQAKKAQQLQAQRLKDLIETEKASLLGSSTVASRGKLLMQFAVVLECLPEGFRKRALYHMKAIKAAFPSKAGAAGNAGTISKAEAANLLSPAASAEAAEQALEQILVRSARDLSGLVDVNQADRTSALQKMKDNGASKQKQQDFRLKLDDQHRAALLLEAQKDMLCLSALRVSLQDLMEVGDGASAPRGLRKADSILDLTLEADESEGQAMIAPFGTNIHTWVRGLLPLSGMYSDALSALVEFLDSADRKIHHQQSGDAAAAGLSRATRDLLLKALLNVMMQSFCVETKRFDSQRFAAFQEGGEVSAVESTIVSVYRESGEGKIQQAFSDASASVEIIEVYSKSIKEWLSHPCLSQAELASKDFAPRGVPHVESRTAEEMKNAQKLAIDAMQSEAREREAELVRSLALKVEKKKKDLQARLALRKEQHTREGTAQSAEAQREEAEAESELKKLDAACSEVTALLKSPTAKLEEINADGLLAAVEQTITTGTRITAAELVALQQQTETANSASATQRLLQQQMESADKLDIAMRVKKARDQKALQDRLLKRQRQKEKAATSTAAAAASIE